MVDFDHTLGTAYDLPMDLELLPYFLLMTAIVAAIVSTRGVSLALFAGALVTGVTYGRFGIELIGCTGLAAPALWLPQKFKWNLGGKVLCYLVFAGLAIALGAHKIPGVQNLVILKAHKFSPDSSLYSMYLNFDKAVVGLLIYLVLLKKSQPAFRPKFLATAQHTLGYLLLLIVPLALAMNFVRVDLKLPDQTWLWLLNNLLFVCFAEEAFFRGFLQKGISQRFPRSGGGSVAAVILGAFIFGLAHYAGGVSYVALSSLAGLFYGYAYQATNRIETAMLVHFGFNTIHFFFFSYPALTQ